ncbi:leucine rich repeat containing 51 isoform X1 [Rhincodon typus]|uniref:leucine rich repeat containing 51 isoform X1 n=1 Tax=Rhincodon typus TaxID=259920 RepID=UPI0009A3DE0B|nr:leucine rich repeat containing 51 isoform X1 [Rhincodon typus]
MEVVDSDTNQWLVDEQEEATRPSTSRNIAGSIKTKEFDSILYGPIVDYSFRNLETLSDCVKLTPRTGFRPNEYTENKKLKSCSLRLSHNRLCDLSGLQQVVDALLVEPERLFWIDLSFNSFPSIDPVLIQCTKLQILNLHGNQISELYEVDKLASLPHLRSLTLHGNPLELVKGYRSYVVGTVPQLKSLDYSTITKQDRSTATVLKSFTKRKRVARRKYDD